MKNFETFKNLLATSSFTQVQEFGDWYSLEYNHINDKDLAIYLEIGTANGFLYFSYEAIQEIKIINNQIIIKDINKQEQFFRFLNVVEIPTE